MPRILLLITFSIHLLFADMGTLWQDVVRPVALGQTDIPTVDGYAGDSYRIGDGHHRSAYHYQRHMQIFMHGASWAKREDWLADIITGLQIIRNTHIHDLGTLRQQALDGEITLDTYYTDTTRSGSINRKVIIFSDTSQTPTYYYWNNISEKQIAGYLARAIMELSRHDLSDTDKAFILDLLDFLVVDYLHPLATMVPAWHWAGDFNNVFDRLDAKLHGVHSPVVTTIPSYGAILDAEWWLFAIAADSIVAINNLNLNSSFDQFHWSSLNGYLNRAYETFQLRLEDDGFFNYDLGMWRDRAAHDWAMRTDKAFPTVNTPPLEDANATWDSSHFRRMAVLLDALEYGHSAQTDYYKGLKERLARHLMEVMVYYDSYNVPLLTTYSHGQNGWYKLNFTEGRGFGPGARSYGLIGADWALLGAQDDRIQTLYRTDIRAVVDSTVPNVVDARTKYYGRIEYPVTGNILGNQDQSGLGSLLDARLTMLEYVLVDTPNVSVSKGLFADHVLLSWKRVQNAIRYEVHRKLSTDSNFAPVYVTDGLYFKDTDAQVGEVYDYQVFAINSYDESMPTISQSGSISSGVISYADWQSSYAGFINGSSGFLDDADGDGILNGVEYATNGDYLNNATGGLISQIGVNALRLMYDDYRRQDAVVQLMESDDMVNWVPVYRYTTLNTRSFSYFDTYMYDINLSNAARFYRLEVTQ